MCLFDRIDRLNTPTSGAPLGSGPYLFGRISRHGKPDDLRQAGKQSNQWNRSENSENQDQPPGLTEIVEPPYAERDAGNDHGESRDRQYPDDQISDRIEAVGAASDGSNQCASNKSDDEVCQYDPPIFRAA